MDVDSSILNRINYVIYPVEIVQAKKALKKDDFKGTINFKQIYRSI